MFFKKLLRFQKYFNWKCLSIYSLTIAIWIFWAPIHHSASTPCFAILLVVCSDESGFHHLLPCIERMLHPPSRTVLEICLWPLSVGACAYQTIDMAPIVYWPSTLQPHLWQYDELCHAILVYTSPLPLTTPIVWSWVADCESSVICENSLNSSNWITHR